MIFNNVLNDRTLDQAHAICSFYDPYIGEDAGYLQVTRLNGHGPALVVVPDGKTPFEAYNPILDHKGHWGAAPVFTDPTPRGITFEGFYEWMVHSQAYAENEWKNAQPWNPPTSLTLAPGESKTYGLKFLRLRFDSAYRENSRRQSEAGCRWRARLHPAAGHRGATVSSVRQARRVFES